MPDDEVDLSKLEIFCPNNECGDPVPYANGARTRRRMNFVGKYKGIFVRLYYQFRCPVCGGTRDIDEFGSDC